MLFCESAWVAVVRVVISRAQDLQWGGGGTLTRFLRNLSCLVLLSEISVIYRLTKAPEGQMAFFMNHLSNVFVTRWSGGTPPPPLQKWLNGSIHLNCKIVCDRLKPIVNLTFSWLFFFFLTTGISATSLNTEIFWTCKVYMGNVFRRHFVHLLIQQKWSTISIHLVLSWWTFGPLFSLIWGVLSSAKGYIWIFSC